MNTKGLVATVVVLGLLAGAMLQADAAGTKDRTRTKDRKRDGSCQATVVAAQDASRDRAWGCCCGAATCQPFCVCRRLCSATDGTTSNPAPTCARIRARDGSCRYR